MISPEEVKRNKQELLSRKTKCCICGESEQCCLELHHIRNKLYNISQAVKKLPFNLFVKECNKCICVCSNCHKKIHAKIITYGPTDKKN